MWTFGPLITEFSVYTRIVLRLKYLANKFKGSEISASVKLTKRFLYIVNVKIF